LNGLKIKTVEQLMWRAHLVGAKNKLHLLQCPRCAAQLFRIDGYLYCILDAAAEPISTALKLDLEISDAVITCQQCGDEIRISDAAVELMKLIASSGAQWMRL
jgi:Zn finger protein HypA/HybF involved in hydrogenase expression